MGCDVKECHASTIIRRNVQWILLRLQTCIQREGVLEVIPSTGGVGLAGPSWGQKRCCRQILAHRLRVQLHLHRPRPSRHLSLDLERELILGCEARRSRGPGAAAVELEGLLEDEVGHIEVAQLHLIRAIVEGELGQGVGVGVGVGVG